MLNDFMKAKGPEIDCLLALEAEGQFPKSLPGGRPSFSKALQAKGPGAVIAEYKRASPSLGVINTGLSAGQVASAYAKGGAACVSVLTEEAFFQGSLGYLAEASQAGLPLLRKDFLFHPLQIRHTAATKASALLLIVRMLETKQLTELLNLCDSLGLEAVTEVFDASDLAKARDAGAHIIQVNNRDLESLTVTLDVSRSLVGAKGPDEVWITASGISQGSQIDEFVSLGFDAALIGTFLMRGPDPEGALRKLLEERDP